MSRGKNFCFTINNYSDANLHSCRTCCGTRDVDFICWQQEVAGSGTPHLQGYIQMARRSRFSAVQLALGGGAHVELARATPTVAREYCQKPDTAVLGSYEEFGVIKLGPASSAGPPGRANQVNFVSILTMIDDGADLRTIIRGQPDLWARYHAAITSAYNLFQRVPVAVKEGPWKWNLPASFTWSQSLVLTGVSGIGKTEWAKSMFPNPLFVSHMDDLRHFDANWHGGIIFDDMGFNHMPRTAQIHIVDIDNPRSIHVRYGVAHIPAGTKKVFTTNVNDIFSIDAAINRRVLFFDCF